MADRGKVLRALKQHLIVHDGEECVDCPYGETDGLECVRQLYADAIELLKEQEPVEPRKILPCITRPVGGYVCGHCGIRFLEKNDYYCPNCGRAVKWEND